MPALTHTRRRPSLRQIIRFRSDTSRLAVRTIALIVAMNGLLAIIEVLSTRISSRFESLLPVNYEAYGRSFGLFVGFTLIYISTRLLLRKRLAWWVAFLGNIGIVFAHFFYFHTGAGLIVPCIALVLLGVYRSEFVAGSEPTTIKQGVLLFVICLVVALSYGTIGFYRLLPRDFSPAHHFPISESFERTIKEFSLIGNEDLHPSTRTAKWFIDSLDILGSTSAAFAIYSLFRPLQYRFSTLPHERERAAHILDRYGVSSEDYFKLWPEDKSYYFLSNEDAFVAYVVDSGTALVLGEPIGPEASWPKILREFGDFCRRHDWLMSFIYIPDTHLKLFEDFGMRAIKIGEDAVVPTDQFATTTIRNKHFRGVLNKFSRLGFRYEVSEAQSHTNEVLKETAAVSRSWLRVEGRRERGFALGSYDRGYMWRSRLHLVYDHENKLVAFANEIHSYNTNQVTIDLMRHRLHAETGSIDYLLASMIQYFHDQGIPEFSLGLAPLAGLLDEDDNPIEQRLLHYAAAVGIGGFSFEGLRRFKNKFEPRWEDRYMVYSSGPVGFIRSGSAVNAVVN